MNIHNLDGCTPTPLAYYLKALGIMKIVAEQVDPQVRGWWEGDLFRLATRLTKYELKAFFLNDYQPTPLVSPWSKGSGFFYTNDPGLTPVESSTAIRFDRLRTGITAGRKIMSELKKADQEIRLIKSETKNKHLTSIQKKTLSTSTEYKKRLAIAEREFKRIKADLIPKMRRSWRGPHREWMDVAMVIVEDGTPRFPALLGTGGNDGRLDFTNNFMQRLNDVFDLDTPNGDFRPLADGWFAAALWREVVPGYKSGIAVGQYLPGMAGGANSSNSPMGDSLLNPVDFILMLEGTLLFTAHTSRRMETSGQSRASAPFIMAALAAGYASAADSDESARGEQWMPLWSQPTTIKELRHLFAEGRAQIGARSVNEPLDMVCAVARFGTARGISAFQRFGYIERNGQSNLAVPLGRFQVPDRVQLRLACLDDITSWLHRLHREARKKQAPSRLQVADRRLTDSLFTVAQHSDDPLHWQAVLQNLINVESIQVTGSGFKAGPIPLLRPAWVSAADDNSPEFRLSVACALQARAFNRDCGGPIDSVRRHWIPLKGNGFAKSGAEGHQCLQIGSDVVMHGHNVIVDAIALVERRLIEAAQSGKRQLPLVAARRSAATSSDLAMLVAGRLNINRIMAMARTLMAIDGRSWDRKPSPASSAVSNKKPDDAWLAIRLATLPWPLPDGRQIGIDPAIVRRLSSGDGTTAVILALRRLRASGITPAVRSAAVSPEFARCWAAALAFPISKNTAADFLRCLDPNSMQGEK